MTELQQEKVEWENLNKLLMRHGLKPVSLAAPQSCRKASDTTVLDSQSSLGIRLALKTLVEDTDRQQKMMQGLMEANRCLRDEIRQERGRASRQEQRANDLENVVKNIKSKICQLEDETIAKVCQQQNQVRELQKDQQVSQAKYQQQQKKLQEQEETILHLQKELCRAGLEEQRRGATQTKLFCRFCKRAPKSLLDQQPTVQELKLYKHQVKKLEKTLKKTTQPARSRTGERPEEKKEPESITGVDQLQAVCQQYLQVLSHIDSILQSPRAPPLIYKRSKGSVQNNTKENGQECGFEHLPLTIEMWADQLMALKDLYRSLRKLSLELMPWHTADLQDKRESIRVEDLQFIVDAILEETENKEKNSQAPSSPTLFAMVSHFQKLFDVNSLNGVYPRMNEVYTKLGEMTNAMKNLHEVLELDSSAPPTVVVDTVGKLCDIINENVTEQVQQLLGTRDIHSIINKLEEHECFFPPFQALVQDLLCLLEISNPDDILPTVQNLKLVAS
ncbi:centrosomal protein of 70 kDa isoform X6 [Apus apus]|uniref:centrosomal protein of 70 kDa isoform X6 n=1 Tax=Apus apus TaxID=8895 RepID=UPI0021F89717|nr:centrosomal protein of 70 kDa isoform X6 [Apus apus]